MGGLREMRVKWVALGRESRVEVANLSESQVASKLESLLKQ